MPEDQEQKVFRHLKFLADFLNTQISLAGCENFPPKVFDDFSIGYIGGFGDAYMQTQGIGNEGADAAYLAVFFLEFYGRQKGQECFNSFLHNQKHPALREGMQIGGNEYMRWITDIQQGKEKNYIPTLLADYWLKT